MFRNYISLLLFIALFAVGSVSVYAQKTIAGKVILKDSKGKKTPFEGARVDCYRLDIKESCGSATTDAEGKFTLKEAPSKAKAVIAVSGPGLAPQVVPNVRIDDTNTFEASEGDGTVPSEEAVRLSAFSYMKEKGELTEAQKAELAEIEKKIAEKEAEIEKVKKNNELRSQLIKEGNDAFNNKDYDLAVAKFDQGYKIDPEYLGSAPVFLNNKAQAIKQRTINMYNDAVKSKDAARIRKAKVDVVGEFTEALTAATKAYQMTSNPKSMEGSNPKKIKEDAKLSKAIVKDIFRIMGIMNINLASNLSTEADATNAVSIYQSALKILPDDPDVIAGLAMALYSSSEFKGDKNQKKESLEYWNKYKKVAPKDHSQQATADGMIEFLKEEVK